MLLFDNWPHLSYQRLVIVIRYSYTSFYFIFYKKLIKNPACEFLNFSGNSGCEFLNFSQIPGSISYSRILIKKSLIWLVQNISPTYNVVASPRLLQHQFSEIFENRYQVARTITSYLTTCTFEDGQLVTYTCNRLCVCFT